MVKNIHLKPTYLSLQPHAVQAIIEGAHTTLFYFLEEFQRFQR